MSGGATVPGKAGPQDVEAQAGDKDLKATFTWTPVNPTAQELSVSIQSDDGTELVGAHGASPLVVTLDHKAWAETGNHLKVAAQPGDCSKPVWVASSQSQTVDLTIAWNS